MGLRLLVVEDQDDFADFVVRGLREEGLTAERAADTPAAFIVARWYRMTARLPESYAPISGYSTDAMSRRPSPSLCPGSWSAPGPFHFQCDHAAAVRPTGLPLVADHGVEYHCM